MLSEALSANVVGMLWSAYWEPAPEAAHGEDLAGEEDGAAPALPLRQRRQQLLRDGRDLIDGAIERGLVYPRRHPVATDLTDELKGRGADLFVGGSLVAAA